MCVPSYLCVPLYAWIWYYIGCITWWFHPYMYVSLRIYVSLLTYVSFHIYVSLYAGIWHCMTNLMCHMIFHMRDMKSSYVWHD